MENPPIPAGPHRDSRVQPIRHQVLVRYPTILRKAFEKYPVATIRKYLKAIYSRKVQKDHEQIPSCKKQVLGMVEVLLRDRPNIHGEVSIWQKMTGLHVPLGHSIWAKQKICGTYILGVQSISLSFSVRLAIR